MNRLFGTDGVRGVANQELTPELAYKLGRAGATLICKLSEKQTGDGKRRPRIAIGRDTRISGQMLEAAIIAGITSVGADVMLLGVVPTPAVAQLVMKLELDAGVMISASHNPVEDNGIKFFAANGFKLTDQMEEQIEKLIHDNSLLPRPIGSEIGRVTFVDGAADMYIGYLAERVPLDLKGMHIAIDCANGAASKFAPEIMRRLGATVSVINAEPDGLNINVECGSTHPQSIQELVRSTNADVGFSHDGDADRILAVDHTGKIIDGDYILGICSVYLLNQGRLTHKKIAATSYSNGGLRQLLKQFGGDVVLTSAGDRYILEAMLAEGLVLGGEQSGHIIFLEDSTTGDGILSALKLLEVMQATGKTLAELAQIMSIAPQHMVNVQVASKANWDAHPKVQETIARIEHRLNDQGRLLIRPSGTEPVIRVMGEHPEQSVVVAAVEEVAAAIHMAQEE